MNTKIICKLTILPLLAAVGLLSACSKQSEPAGQDDHAGHKHGEPAAETKAPPGKKMCAEHNVPLEECGICRPLLAGTLKPGESAKVRLASNESADIAGVQTAAPTVGTIADAVECYAELTFNQNKLAQIAAPVGGIIPAVLILAGLGGMVSTL